MMTRLQRRMVDGLWQMSLHYRNGRGKKKKTQKHNTKGNLINLQMSFFMLECLECILGRFSFLEIINHQLRKKKRETHLSSKAVLLFFFPSGDE